MRKLTLAGLLATCLLLILAVISAPAEQVLGADARLVYLHGAWVWAALAGLLAAAACGLAGLALRLPALHAWSRALGRTGLLLWITFLPLSLLVMRTSWNGLFLAEPRWRMSVTFAVAGLLLQAGISLLEPAWASAANLAFGVVLLFSVQKTAIVMHPSSPILNTQSLPIRLSFAAMLAFLLLAGAQITILFGSLGFAVKNTRFWGVWAVKPPTHPKIWDITTGIPKDPPVS